MSPNDVMIFPSHKKIIALQEFQTIRAELKHSQQPTLWAFGILAADMFIERWTRSPQVRFRFQTAQTA